MRKFRKPQVIVGADRYDGLPSLTIQTFEGPITASHGDWIITKITGEKYPWMPEFYRESYAPADYVLAVKESQPTLLREMAIFYAGVEAGQIDEFADLDNNRGRIEQRRCVVCADIGWLIGERRYSGNRFPKLAAFRPDLGQV